MILYLLQSTLCLTILILVYTFLLEGEQMHTFKRFYLLFALLFSIVAPFIHLPIEFSWWQTMDKITPLIWDSPVSEGTPAESPLISTYDMLSLIYIAGVVVFSLRFIIQLGSLYHKIQRYPKVHFKDYSLVLLPTGTSAETVPHTFGSYIFLNANDYHHGKIEPELLTHELAHVRERHSADVMIVELLKIGLWFQPLIYLYQKAIRLNHEFLADAAVLRQNTNIAQYQHLLLDKVAASSKIHLASNLNFLLTKKRLNMMSKNTTRRRALILGSLTIPIFVFLLLAAAQPLNAQTHSDRTVVDEAVSHSEIKKAYFEKATFVFLKDGKEIKKKFSELSPEEFDAIPMPPPPPPAPPVPTAKAGATPPAPPIPPTLPTFEPLKEGAIVQVDLKNNRIWIKSGDLKNNRIWIKNGDKAIAPPPPPPPPPSEGNQ